ncbi:MAG: hypothetical protein AAF382_06680 [Pseudomonadota bacterium]
MSEFVAIIGGGDVTGVAAEVLDKEPFCDLANPSNSAPELQIGFITSDHAVHSLHASKDRHIGDISFWPTNPSVCLIANHSKPIQHFDGSKEPIPLLSGMTGTVFPGNPQGGATLSGDIARSSEFLSLLAQSHDLYSDLKDWSSPTEVVHRYV